MSFILGNEMILIPLFGITVFIFAYFTSDRIVDYLARRSLGSREEVLSLMDKMFIDTDQTKVTYAMLAGSLGSVCSCSSGMAAFWSRGGSRWCLHLSWLDGSEIDHDPALGASMQYSRQSDG